MKRGTGRLRYYQGMKVDDVAQTLQTTRSGVKHRLKQANKLLRTQLEGWYYDEEWICGKAWIARLPGQPGTRRMPGA